MKAMSQLPCILCALALVGVAAVRTQAEAPYNVQWTRQFGTAEFDGGFSVATVGSGAGAFIYTSGGTHGSLAGPKAGAEDAFLTKHDAAGNLLWSRQIGTKGDDDSEGVATDASGNAYITGATYGSLAGPSAGSYDAFLAKYDGAGNQLWSRQIGTFRDEYGSDVAVDAANNVFMCGDFFGYGFLAKYDGAGNQLWFQQFGGGFDYADSRSVAVDGAGNAYVSGYTEGSLGGPQIGNGDAYLSKFDAAGNLLWSRQIGTADYDVSESVAVDSNGSAYVSGETAGNLVGPNSGSFDAFLAKYDSAGNLLWKRQIGTTEFDECYGAAVDHFGNIFLSGDTTGTLGDFSSGGYDPFLVKFDSAGDLIWTKQLPTGAEFVADLAIDGSGNPYITGYTGGDLAGPQAGNSDAFLIKFAVPEPSAIMLAAIGVIGVAFFCRRAIASDDVFPLVHA